jgi:hypothetical protein
MATNSQVVKTITIQLNTKDSKIKIDGITKRFVEAGEAAQNFSAKASQGFDALATGANNARSATGSASATVLEAGRVVSDFNYGIRGVANNLSQLANNFIFTAEKAGGFTAGLKDIGKAFMGPLGIILAINVVIAAFERFSMEAEKAKKATDDLNSSVKDELTILKIYQESLSQTNITLEERATIVKGLSILDKELSDNLKEAADDTERLRQITEDFIRIKELEIEIDLKRIDLQDAYNKRLDLSTEKEEMVTKVREAGFFELAFMTMNFGGLRKTIFDEIAESTGDLTEADEEYNKVLKEYLDLIKEINKEEKENTNNIRSFKQKYLDLSKVISGFERQEELAVEENEEMKLLIKQKYERKDLALRLKSFKDREKLRKDDFLASNADEEQKALAKERFNASMLKADEDYQKALTQLLETQEDIRYKFRFEKSKEYYDKVQRAKDAGEIQALAFDMGRDSGVDALETQQELLQLEHEQKLFFIDLEIQERKRAKEEYEDLELEKKNATEKFNNESLDITEKTEKAKRAVVALGFQAIAQIAGEGSRVGKLASAAAAVMSTYEAVNSALGAKPYGPWNIAQAAIVAAMGFANVKKILQTPIPTGNGTQTTTGGDAGRTFDFNLVGSSGVNQLSQAIGSQFQEPVQAYVVSSQITSQQELDLEISTGASLGD